jgi:hypothetical protein
MKTDAPTHQNTNAPTHQLRQRVRFTLDISVRLWEILHIISGRLKQTKKEVVNAWIQRGISSEVEFRQVIRELDESFDRTKDLGVAQRQVIGAVTDIPMNTNKADIEAVKELVHKVVDEWATRLWDEWERKSKWLK